MPATPKPKTVKGKVVRIAQDVDVRSLITNTRYVDCEILGPAILAPLDTVNFQDSNFDAPAEAIFYTVDPDRPAVGVIGLMNVEFRECRFKNVGIIAIADVITKFRSGMGQG